MSTADFLQGKSSVITWQKLYERAILELDKAKMPERIVQARRAIHDRAEEVLTDSTINESERRALHSALRALDVLEEVSTRGKSA